MRIVKIIGVIMVFCPMYGWWCGQVFSLWGLIPAFIGGAFIGNFIATVYEKKS